MASLVFPQAPTSFSQARFGVVALFLQSLQVHVGGFELADPFPEVLGGARGGPVVQVVPGGVGGQLRRRGDDGGEVAELAVQLVGFGLGLLAGGG